MKAMIFKLAFRNIISRRSSLVIIIFMAFAVTMLSVTNAVFDSTEQGVQSSFTKSFTGDFIIRPKSSSPLSLFGDETPVTGELTELSSLIPYEQIISSLQKNSNITNYVPQLSGISMIEHDGFRFAVCMFGVPGKQYVDSMSSLHIEEGSPYSENEKGVMISRSIASRLNASVGDKVQFTVADGPSFRIRAATVSAIYSYEVDNPIFEKFVLLNPDTMCSIMQISDSSSVALETINEEKTDLITNEIEDLDDLFAESDDTGAVVESHEENLEQIPSKELSEIQSTSWNFIICFADENENVKKTIRQLNSEFKKNDWPVEAVNWRSAAGSTALYLYWIRMVFNIGIFIVLFAGLIIINNTLVINVIDRTKEIGTFLALGAGGSFVSLQCMVENFMLALTSGVLGTAVSFLLCFVINKIQITFTNSFIVQLFGGSVLHTSITESNILSVFILVLVLGFVGWVYPVATALKITPVQAMQGDNK